MMMSIRARAVNFIQSQLAELVKNCGNTVQDGLVEDSFFMELENKLEKILHETHTAHRPPPIKPVKSDFDFIRLIASGSFGTVNLVRHKKSRQVFAMKQIKLEDEEQRDEVLQERDILTFLDSSFVTSLFCSFETEKRLYMVMEYVGGGDVGSLLDYNECFPVDMSRFYIAELVLALEYIHSHGIIHRDLKPDNLLITTTGHIKVADFGLSKFGSVNIAACLTEEDCQRVAREFTDEEVYGTPCYIAPEVYLRTGYGKPIDWWSTGIILYEFLYGFTPFDKPSSDSDDLEGRVISDDISWPLHKGHPLPLNVRSLISRLLDKNCVTRLGTRGADEVKGQLFFQDVDWSNLHNQTPPYVPALENKEDTGCFHACPPVQSDKCLDDGDNQDASPAVSRDLCYYTLCFMEEYSSPQPLSDHTLKTLDQLSEEPEHNEAEEEPEIKAINGGCDSTHSPPSQQPEQKEAEEKPKMQAINGGCDSTHSPPSQQPEQKEAEEKPKMQAINGGCDSTHSPPSQHASPVQMVPKQECLRKCLLESCLVWWNFDFLQAKLENEVEKFLHPEQKEAEEEPKMQAINGGCDSTHSPPSQHASPVQMVPEQECLSDEDNDNGSADDISTVDNKTTSTLNPPLSANSMMQQMKSMIKPVLWVGLHVGLIMFATMKKV